jgi:hypothetical protein
MSDSWLRRIAWGTALLAIVLLIVSAIVLLSAPDPANTTWLSVLGASIAALGAPILGLIIVLRQPRNRIGWLWIIYALAVGVRSLGHGIYYASGAQPVGYSALELFFLWATEPANLVTFACLILLLLWFPDGHLPSRRWRFLYVWFFLALAVLFSSNFAPGPNWNGGEAGRIVIDNPYGWLPANLTNSFFGKLGFPSFISLILITILAAISLILRYRSAGPVVRLQLRWFVVGGFFTVILFFLPVTTLMPNQNSAGFNNLLLLLGQAYMIPLYLAVGVAILRYRLFDFDVIIRKTLVYTVLTALLALVYFGIVVLLQGLFSRLAGVQQSTLAVVISTLIIVALSAPLRRRIQDGIDRRFYRKKYNAQQVLAQFALTARDETDLDALLAELVRVVDETLQPEHVSIWLRKTNNPQDGYAVGSENKL